MLVLDPRALAEIITHARTDAPIEACGYIGEKDGVASCVIRLTNVDQARDHFALEPREQFEAVRAMRAKGFRLAVVYHSHPETPARPSAEDIRLAFDPRLTYVIVSLAASEPEVKAFRIARGLVTAEPITPSAARSAADGG
jgi:proteasome lid subunit RPN8/RPN11